MDRVVLMVVETPIGPGFLIFFSDDMGGPIAPVDKVHHTDDDDILEIITILVNADVFD